MKHIVIRDKAQQELQQAYDWYETQQAGLGSVLLEVIKTYLDTISRNPFLFQKTYKNFREAWIGKFPYLIVYFFNEDKNQVIIFSFFHTSQNPKKKFK